MTQTIISLWLERCEIRDSDACLQASPGWGDSYNCKNSANYLYCTIFGKDLRRCCPESCGTWEFTKQDCLSFSGSGTCTYPNEAQCSGNLRSHKSEFKN